MVEYNRFNCELKIGNYTYKRKVVCKGQNKCKQILKSSLKGKTNVYKRKVVCK